LLKISLDVKVHKTFDAGCEVENTKYFNIS